MPLIDVSIVFLIKDHKIYIQLRPPDKSPFPNTYEPIQETVKDKDGTPSIDNSHYLNCAIRGLREEVGINVTKNQLESILHIPNREIERDGVKYNLRGQVYIATSDQKLTPNPKEAIPEQSYPRTIAEIETLTSKNPTLEYVLPRIKLVLEARL